MEVDDTHADEYISMWTVQTKKVIEILNREGITYVKNQYIAQKYKDTAWSFQEAYRFFSKKARLLVGKPEEADSPIWMFCDRRWAVADQDTLQIQLNIPREEVILFDMRTWSKILSLSFVGTEVQEKEFAKELKRMGITHSCDVFDNPYYPFIKSKILKSWERLFTEECTDIYYMQGATWKLKQEWIVT